MYEGYIMTIDPDKEITCRTFEYCHACGEERIEGQDYPWCNDECLQVISDAWWEEYRKHTTKGKSDANTDR
jgi:hypothetical protein